MNAIYLDCDNLSYLSKNIDYLHDWIKLIHLIYLTHQKAKHLKDKVVLTSCHIDSDSRLKSWKIHV